MSFILDGGQYEWKITNDGVTCGAAHLSDGTLEDGLYDKLSVGNVVARQLKVTLWNVDIDPTKPLTLTLDKTFAGATEPLAKGTYFVDTINASPYSEYADFTAYDALLKTDAPFMTSGGWSATTSYAIVAEIATRIGVSIEAATDGYLSANSVSWTEAPSIGANGTTMREMLSAAGAIYGGNFFINDNNELSLALLSGKLFANSIVTIDENGLFQLKLAPKVGSGDSVICSDDQGEFYADAFTNITDATVVTAVGEDGLFLVDTWGNLKVVVPSTEVKVIGDEVVEFVYSPLETINGVEVWAGTQVAYRAWDTDTYPTWDDVPDTILSVQMATMASQAVADALWEKYAGFEYLPYAATGVYTDPETSLGTSIEIKDKTVLLTKRIQNIDPLSACELDAEAIKQAISYYPYLSPTERSLQKDINENSARITVNEADISEEVRSRAEEDGKLVQRIGNLELTDRDFRVEFTENIPSQIEGAVNELADEISNYLSYAGGVVKLGTSQNPVHLELRANRLSFVTAGGTELAYFSDNNLYITDAIIENSLIINRTGGSDKWIEEVDSNGYLNTRYIGG